jgi:FtsP/CotA-like multicopper oxidase with cupredoxin domain
MKKVGVLLFIFTTAVLSACTGQTATNQEKEQASPDQTAPVESIDSEEKKVNEYTVTAQTIEWMLNGENMVEAWTYGGTVPGKEIRVTEGETVKVNLKNELPKPVTIHWHGVPVPNSEDGVAGVTQDAVPPGESYTYQFKATVPGTYWYHSHQNSVEQVDKGLYGVFIVEPKEGVQADRDYTLVLDEWQSKPMEMGERKADDNMSGMNMEQGGMMGHDMSSYDIFIVNGKTYEENKPLEVNKGETVKLRLVNAGYIVHKIHIPVDYKVTHVDGQPVNNPSIENGSVLEIAPGERYDIAFTADSGENFTLEDHIDMPGAKYMKMDVVYANAKGEMADHPEASDVVNLMNLGEKEQGPFSLNDSFDVEYKMDLGSTMNKENMEMEYTINNETYPDVPPLKIDEGDLVKVTLTNKKGGDDPAAVHPMHLHGHFFQVLIRNGKTVQGAPIIKDTLNVKPGETYVVAFEADTPGNWLFHCHDLHHATAGMLQLVKYNNFEDFEPSGEVNNITE